VRPNPFAHCCWGLTLPAQAITFQTVWRRWSGRWIGSQFECRLTQPVNGYGRRVARRAGERRYFPAWQAVSNLMQTGQQARSYITSHRHWRHKYALDPCSAGLIERASGTLGVSQQQAGQDARQGWLFPRAASDDSACRPGSAVRVGQDRGGRVSVITRPEGVSRPAWANCTSLEFLIRYRAV